MQDGMTVRSDPSACSICGANMIESYDDDRVVMHEVEGGKCLRARLAQAEAETAAMAEALGIFGLIGEDMAEGWDDAAIHDLRAEHFRAATQLLSNLPAVTKAMAEVVKSAEAIAVDDDDADIHGFSVNAVERLQAAVDALRKAKKEGA